MTNLPKTLSYNVGTSVMENPNPSAGLYDSLSFSDRPGQGWADKFHICHF